MKKQYSFVLIKHLDHGEDYFKILKQNATIYVKTDVQDIGKTIDHLKQFELKYFGIAYVYIGENCDKQIFYLVFKKGVVFGKNPKIKYFKREENILNHLNSEVLNGASLLVLEDKKFILDMWKEIFKGIKSFDNYELRVFLKLLEKESEK